MRIHRIRLHRYRGVGDAEVHFPERGVCIVEGDNEVGKTSLAESVDLLFRHRDSSTHRAVKAVQPVHLDEGPEVEVEVSTGGYRFTYAKRWLRQKQTTLTVHAPVREQLTGREAHERVEAMLDETLDRPLWEALNLQQGGGAEQADLDVGSLGRALDAAAGGECTGATEDLLWERACAERDRYWTATGKPSRERQVLTAELAAAHEQVARVLASIRELDEAADEVERLAAAAVELDADQAARLEAEDELRARAEVVAQHRQEVERAHAAVARADAEAAASAAAAERRAQLREALTAAEAELAGRTAAADQALPALEAAQARERTAEAAVAAAQERATALAQVVDVAAADRDDRRRAIEVEQLHEREQRVRRAEQALRDADAVLEGCQVDAAAVQRLERAHEDVVRAEAALEADAATVEVVALRDHQVQVDGRSSALAAEEAAQHTVTGSLQLVVADVARVQVTANASSRARSQRLAEAREAFEALAEHLGVDGLDAARSAAAARADAERTRDEARQAIGDNLRDLTLDVLAEKVERHRLRLDAYAEQRPDEPPRPADLEQAQQVLRGAERDRDRAVEAAADAARAHDDARAAVADARAEDAGLTAHVEHAEAAVDQCRAALARDRAHTCDDEVAAGATAARERLAEAVAAGRQADERLASQDPDTLDTLLANAVDARTRSAEALRANRERQHHLRGLIEARGGDGLAQRLDDATTTCAHLDARCTDLERRAAAARVLHGALAARRDEARDRYVAPFRERIEQLGRLVFGPSLEIQLDAGLGIASRTLHGVTVAFTSLSTGAKEQLAILSRLACAAIVADDGGAPVVLDDALGWTDPARLDGMGAAISLAGRDCQVIVLTCTPGRYASVGQATVVHLRAPGATTSGDDGQVHQLPVRDPAAA